MSEIESLKFFRDRVELAGPDGHAINRVKSKDRTVSLVRKWMAIASALKDFRQSTTSFCEAIENKNGVVSLKVVDRAGFDALQAQIQQKAKELAAVEDAIKKLDSFGELWYNELESSCGSWGRVEHVENAQIARMSAGYLQKGANSGKTPEEILSDPEFIRLKKLSEDQIAQAAEQLKVLRPRLEAIKSILEAVNC